MARAREMRMLRHSSAEQSLIEAKASEMRKLNEKYTELYNARHVIPSLVHSREPSVAAFDS
jgi:hypothetical protein